MSFHKLNTDFFIAIKFVVILLSNNDIVNLNLFLFFLDNPIVTIQEGTSTVYNEGDRNKILHCTASSKPTSVFTWYHGNSRISTSTSPVSTNHFNYNFNTVSKTHYGVYKCEADNSIGSKGQDSITVRVECKYYNTVILSSHVFFLNVYLLILKCYDRSLYKYLLKI